MMSCRRASELISRELDGELSWPQSASLRVHRWLCGNCRRFSNQLNCVHSSLQDLFRLPIDETPDLTPLPTDTRARLQETLAHAVAGPESGDR